MTIPEFEDWFRQNEMHPAIFEGHAESAAQFAWESYAALSAASTPVAAEPSAWMRQHGETGHVGFVDPWQVENDFQAANPRLKLIEPVYRHAVPPVPPVAAESTLAPPPQIHDLLHEVRAMIPESDRAHRAIGEAMRWIRLNHTSRGWHALADVVSKLKETGHYCDEEGEDTTDLEELLLATPPVTPAEARTANDDFLHFCSYSGNDSKDLKLRMAYEHGAALRAPVSSQPTGWQDIATAPKDGTVIWAFNGEQGRMHWTEGEIAGERWALWAWDDQVLADVDPAPDQPTHYMPLPAAPAPKEAT